MTLYTATITLILVMDPLGNIPIFLTIGKQQKEVIVDAQGEIQAVSTISLKFSFDERIADGFYCLRGLGIFKEIISNPDKFIPIE